MPEIGIKSLSPISPVFKLLSSDHLEEHLTQLSRMKTFRQHSAYNLRCLTHILQNSRYEDKKDLVRMFTNFNGIAILSGCLHSWEESDKSGSKHFNESDLHSITLISNILQFLVESDHTQIQIIKEYNIIPILLDIIKKSDSYQLEDINGAIKLLNSIVIISPQFVAELDAITILSQKFNELNLNNNACPSIIQIFSNALKQVELQETTMKYFNKTSILQKFDDDIFLLYDSYIAITDTFQNTILSFLTLIHEVIQIQNSSLKIDLQGIKFTECIGRLVRYFPTTLKIIDTVGILLSEINQGILTKLSHEIVTNFESEEATSNSNSSVTGNYLDAILGLATFPEGRLECQGSEITNLVIDFSKSEDAVIRRRALEILRRLVSDPVVARNFSHNKIIMSTVLGVFTHLATDSHRPVSQNALYSITQSLDIMTLIGLATDELDFQDQRAVWSEVADLMIGRPDLLHTRTLAEAYLNFMRCALHRDPSLCSQAHINSIGCAVSSSGTDEQSPDHRRRTIQACVSLFEEMNRQLSGASRRKKKEALEALCQATKSLTILFNFEAMDQSDDEDRNRIVAAISGLSSGCEKAGAVFVKRLLNDIPNDTAQSSTSQLRQILTNLEEVAVEVEEEEKEEVKPNNNNSNNNIDNDMDNEDGHEEDETEDGFHELQWNGWSKGLASNGRVFFFNDATEVSEWRAPEDLINLLIAAGHSPNNPDIIIDVCGDWYEIIDSQKGFIFYRHSGSKQQSLVVPEGYEFNESITLHLISEEEENKDKHLGNTTKTSSQPKVVIPVEENNEPIKLTKAALGLTIETNLSVGSESAGGLSTTSITAQDWQNKLPLPSCTSTSSYFNEDISNKTKTVNFTEHENEVLSILNEVEVDTEVEPDDIQDPIPVKRSLSKSNSDLMFVHGSLSDEGSDRRVSLKASAQLQQHLGLRLERVQQITNSRNTWSRVRTSSNDITRSNSTYSLRSKSYSIETGKEGHADVSDLVITALESMSANSSFRASSSTLQVEHDLISDTSGNEELIEGSEEEEGIVEWTPSIEDLKDKKNLYSTLIVNCLDSISEYTTMTMVDRVVHVDTLKKYAANLTDIENKFANGRFHRDFTQDGIIIQSLINALKDCMRGLEESAAKLSFYSWQDRENSLLYHLELTMSMLKGEIFSLTQDGVAEYSKVIDAVSKSDQLCGSMFKTAHLEIKRVVMELAGEQKHDTRWSLTDTMLEQVSEFKRMNLLKNLRVLVVCFDNFNSARKDSLTTASEIVKNREWLVKLGRICILAEQDIRKRAEIVRRVDPFNREYTNVVSRATTNSSNNSVISITSSSGGGSSSSRQQLLRDDHSVSSSSSGTSSTSRRRFPKTPVGNFTMQTMSSTLKSTAGGSNSSSSKTADLSVARSYY